MQKQEKKLAGQTMQKGEMRKKVVSMPITLIKKVIVEVSLDETLKKINRHGTKMLSASVCYYGVKDADNKKQVEATCRLRKDGTIVWDFEEECPIEVTDTVKSLFQEDMLTAYFRKLK